MVINQSERTSQRRKAKAPEIFGQREGAKHKKDPWVLRRSPHLRSPAVEFLAAAAITAPLYAGEVRGKSVAAILPTLPARGVLGAQA
jgi:hypothetical protein